MDTSNVEIDFLKETGEHGPSINPNDTHICVVVKTFGNSSVE